MSGVFDHAASSGQTVDVDNILLFPERKKGFFEESYFIGQFIPLRQDDGRIGGFYNTVYESTDRILHERRRLVVDEIAAMHTHSVYETVMLVIRALRENPNDITMCLLYSYLETGTDDEPNLHCVGRISVPEDHPCAPKEANLERGQSGFIEHFRRARNTGKPVVLSQSDGSLGTVEGLEGVEWCGYGEPSRDVAVISLSNGGNLLGFMVLGTNPRRIYDGTTERSIVDMARQIEAKWGGSISAEQYEARERILEQRATDSESKIRHMAKYAPLGMCQVGQDQLIHFANDQFYEITGHDRSKPSMNDYFQVLHPDEVDATISALNVLLDGSQRIEREIRLRRSWTPPVEGAEECSAWILTHTFPLIEDDGSIKLIMSYVLDISHQKWAESVQLRNAAAVSITMTVSPCVHTLNHY
jgi:PAS domain-containing protein